MTGYDTCENISDSGAEVVFPSDKKNISMNFPMLSGEGNSQYITFIMPRYSDGVDLVSKSIRIHYENAAGYNGISIPVNVGFSDENITAGWHVPFEACSVCGMIGVQIEAYDNSFMWCSGIAYGNVSYSLLEDSERKEYIPGSELVTRGQLGDYLERASLAVNASAESARYSEEYSQLSHDYAEAAGNSEAGARNYAAEAGKHVNKAYEYAVTAGENIETLLDLMSKCNKAQKACTDAADNANEKAALVGEAVQAAEQAAESAGSAAENANTAASAAQAAAETVHPNVLYTASSPLEVNTIYNLGCVWSTGERIDIVLPKGNYGDCIQVDFGIEPSGNIPTISVSSAYGITDFDLKPTDDSAYSILFDWGLIGYENVNYGIAIGWRISYAEYKGTDNNYGEDPGYDYE